MSVGDIFNLQTKKVRGLELAKPSLAVGFPEEQNWKWTEGGWVEMVFIAEVCNPHLDWWGICINHFHFLYWCFMCLLWRSAPLNFHFLEQKISLAITRDIFLVCIELEMKAWLSNDETHWVNCRRSSSQQIISPIFTILMVLELGAQ